jgi:hypothetical protein
MLGREKERFVFLSLGRFGKPAIRAFALLLFSLIAFATPAIAAAVEKFSMIQGATTVGTISAATEGAVVTVD